MSVAIQPTAAASFGVASGPDTFQSRSVALNVDKKVAKGRSGETIGFAFYGKKAEHSIEALGSGATAYALGAVAAAPAYVVAAVAGSVFVVEDLSITRSNEDFSKSSIKVTEYYIED